MSTFKQDTLGAVLLTCGILLAAVPGVVANNWTGASDNDWFNGLNWSANHYPAGGEDAVISGGGSVVVLTSTTANLNSLTIGNATLICSNWDTQIQATAVVIQNGGIITLPDAFINGGVSNRIYLVCNDLTINTGGKIDADSRGYWAFNGPGAGQGYYRGGGGGHGGLGGSSPDYTAYGGDPYDSVSDPEAPGSGGGESYDWLVQGYPPTQHGGGAVRIDATGTVAVNGTITANGGTYAGHAGGGSGGAILIHCVTFAGPGTGMISADGGAVWPGMGYWGNSGGAGGRIAIHYTTMTPGTGVRFSTAPGAGSWSEWDPDSRWYAGPEWGTLYLSDSLLLSSVMTDFVLRKTRLVIPGFAEWSVDNLVVSNCSFSLGENGFTLTVTNNLQIDGDAALWLGTVGQTSQSILRVGGDLVLAHGGALYVQSGNTNDQQQDHGALVAVTNKVVIGSGSWIYPYSQMANGGSVLIHAGTLQVETNAGINAAGRGFEGLLGPGAGGDAYYRGGGGGHGGKGGQGEGSAGGGIYDSSNAPAQPGSGGGCSYYGIRLAAPGGGMVRIMQVGKVTLDGTISAGGGNDESGYGGGGSGGSVLITCEEMIGASNGVVTAAGGNCIGSLGGGAGGGRIAIWRGVSQGAMNRILAGEAVPNVTKLAEIAEFKGQISVTNGLGMTNLPPGGAEPGSVAFWSYDAAKGAVLSVW